MSKKNRLIIVTICTVLFLVITPCIIFYSLGYRFDLVNGKVIETGGIYIRVIPYGADITINSQIKNKTGLFSNSIFVQNLLPEEHNVLIEKEGYYSYEKNLLVVEQEVTKLENVILFKNKIAFELLEENIDKFYIAPNNNSLIKVVSTNQGTNFELTNLESSYKKNITLSVKNDDILDSKWSNDSKNYLLKTTSDYFVLNTYEQIPQFKKLSTITKAKEIYFNPQNSDEIFFLKNQNIYSTLQSNEIINNAVGFLIKDQKIVWLSSDGLLYSYNLPIKITDNESQKINTERERINNLLFPIKKDSQYKLISLLDTIFLQENNSLFILNKELKNFEKFNESFKDLKISPDNQKVIFYDDYEISYSLTNLIDEKILLKKFDNPIDQIYWLNSDYLILKSGEEVIISEIDARGNVNTISLPKVVLSSEGEQTNNTENKQETELKLAKIFFNEQDKKIYILAEGNLVASERITP